MTPTPSLALVGGLACRDCAVRRFCFTDGRAEKLMMDRNQGDRKY